MAPNPSPEKEAAISGKCNNRSHTNMQMTSTTFLKQKKNEDYYKTQIVWAWVAVFTYMHIGAVYGCYLIITSGKLATFLWGFLLVICSNIGITGGAHRLWCHRAYKAKWPLKLILAIFQTLAFQNDIYTWARNHRVHHKFTDTDADPHNVKRGFFFSHLGWLLVRKHPDVKIKGKTLEMSDLEQDFIVMWQKKTYWLIMPLISFVLPTWVPIYFWNETFWNSWYIAAVTRYTFALNFILLVNSAAHMWGTKPYDRNIFATENVSVAVLAGGEGWHNFHHAFPWDYKASELGRYNKNITAGFIDFFAKIGWAYDLKTVSPEMVQRRIERTGDGSHPRCTAAGEGQDKEMNIWGWGDNDMPDEDIRQVNIAGKKD